MFDRFLGNFNRTFSIRIYCKYCKLEVITDIDKKNEYHENCLDEMNNKDLKNFIENNMSEDDKEIIHPNPHQRASKRPLTDIRTDPPQYGNSPSKIGEQIMTAPPVLSAGH